MENGEKSPITPTGLITIRMAARILGVSRHTILRMIQRQELTAYRIGERSVRVLRTSINDHLSAQRIVDKKEK